jgi:hypothetical protein
MSETAKHTPGPWKWDGGGYVDAPAGCIAGINATSSPSVSEANARLIAAAPELLAACRVLLEGIDDHWATTEAGINAIDYARIAISKATGVPHA